MSKESYIRGFCKAAEAAGADPKALAKYVRTTSSNAMHEAFSPMYNLFVGKLVGTAAGGIIAKAMGKNVADGMRGGKIAGMLVPSVANVVGAISAAVTRRRTNKEQERHDKGSTWASSMFIPGAGVYNHYKRVGSWKNEPQSQNKREK